MASPTRLLRTALLLALSLALLPSLLAAQVPKVGRDVYEDSVVYGFRMKVPKDWKQVPPQPGEENLLASFNDPNNGYIFVGGQGDVIPIVCYLLVMDDRSPDGESTLDDGEDVGGRILELVQDRLSVGAGWEMKGKKPKKLKIKGVDAAFSYALEAQHRKVEDALIDAYVAQYDLEPGLSIFFLGIGPGGRKWRSYESVYAKLAKSFERVEVVGIGGDPDAAKSPRDKKRRKLQEEVARSPEWALYETEHYLIVSDVHDKPFLDELMQRIEAIRKAYEELYPPEQARAIRAKKEEEAQAAAAAGEEGDGEEDQESQSVQDPMQASLASVLRVCSDESTYRRYGGPAGTGGYWNWGTEELVIYDDKKGLGRDWTWVVLNHEAFHQYIFYFYGKLSPHSWYNEGSGDFYGGFKFSRKKFHLAENQGRLERIRQSIRDGRVAPLEDFVRWTQSQYYGTNDLNLEGYETYAQGWSLVYFLRTGPKKKPRGWQKEWGSILDIYLETLATTGDLDLAIDKAFEGVDWTAFQECWEREFS